jgi:DNA/RNA endonuclease YhcR with UshA esterase domain
MLRMSHGKYVAALAFLFFTSCTYADSFTTSEAAKHVGENATVCGVVAGVHTATSSKGSPTFVNLDKPYPNQVFTILIWGSDLSKFSPAPTGWEGKRVCATGKMERYRNVPEIVARDAGQVSFPK